MGSFCMWLATLANSRQALAAVKEPSFDYFFYLAVRFDYSSLEGSQAVTHGATLHDTWSMSWAGR
jgi:hypothetical protein